LAIATICAFGIWVDYKFNVFCAKYSTPPLLQSQGYEAVLSFDDGLTCYFDGEEVTETEWQESMKVKADGIVGNKTLQKAVELNDMDIRGL
jgi:hypothetical protein